MDNKDLLWKKFLSLIKKKVSSLGYDTWFKDTELVDLNEASWNQDQWDEIVCIFGHFPEELRRKTLLGVKKALELNA